MCNIAKSLLAFVAYFGAARVRPICLLPFTFMWLLSALVVGGIFSSWFIGLLVYWFLG